MIDKIKIHKIITGILVLLVVIVLYGIYFLANPNNILFPYPKTIGCGPDAGGNQFYCQEPFYSHYTCTTLTDVRDCKLK